MCCGTKNQTVTTFASVSLLRTYGLAGVAEGGFLSQGFAFMLFCPDKPFQLLLIYLPNHKDADLSS